MARRPQRTVPFSDYRGCRPCIDCTLTLLSLDFLHVGFSLVEEKYIGHLGRFPGRHIVVDSRTLLDQ